MINTTNNSPLIPFFSLMKFISNNVDHKFVEEEEAGRRFLETLRKAHEYDEAERVSELKSEAYNGTNDFVSSVELASEEDFFYGEDDVLSQRKMKRKLMRNSLERMISLYLNKIRDEHDYEVEESRNKRDAPNNSEKTKENNESNDTNDVDKINKKSAKLVKKGKKIIRSECKQIRRRIANLDRYEIEMTQQKSPKNEFNIRKKLNYR